MAKAPPPLSALVLSTLRRARGWSGQRLAAACGFTPQMLSKYETRLALEPGRLKELAAKMGYGGPTVEFLLADLNMLLRAPDRRAPLVAVDLAAELSAEELEQVREKALAVGRAMAERIETELALALVRRRRREERAEAARLWRELKRRPPSEQRTLIERSWRHRTAAMCERLAQESERAAAHDARKAEQLAGLAVRLADLLPGPPELRARAKGHGMAFVANALRVGGEPRRAEEVFSQAWQLFREGDGAGAGGGFFPEWRLLDLEASLRRGLREWRKALDLLQRAQAAALKRAAGRILLNRAVVLEQMCEVEQAVAVLEEAEPLLAGRREPRLAWVLRFNLATNLCHLGRFAEAETRLPEVRDLAAELGNELDLLRVRWLSGRVAAGLGRVEEAAAALDEVRREFARRDNPYDSALACLELAALRLECGHPPAVRSLAEGMLPIFRAQGIHREALAALQLFCQAALEETLTVEQARRMMLFLERSRREPGLRFEDCP